MNKRTPGQLFLLIVFTALCILLFISLDPTLCAIGCVLSFILIFGWAKWLDLNLKERPYKTYNGFIVISTSQVAADKYGKYLEEEYKDWFDNLEKRV